MSSMLDRYSELFRVVWVAGRYGGGKTSLAVNIGVSLLASQAVQSVACNFHLHPPFRLVREYEHFEDLIEAETGCCMIFDEAWSELGLGTTPQKIKTYLAYLRKRQSVLLLPSVIPLVRQVRVVQVSRVLNGFAFGLPLWLYRVTTETGERKPERFYHWWWYPQTVWALYDSKEYPSLDWRVYRVGSAERDVTGGD